jgi:hypothetical protein
MESSKKQENKPKRKSKRKSPNISKQANSKGAQNIDEVQEKREQKATLKTLVNRRKGKSKKIAKSQKKELEILKEEKTAPSSSTWKKTCVICMTSSYFGVQCDSVTCNNTFICQVCYLVMTMTPRFDVVGTETFDIVCHVPPPFSFAPIDCPVCRHETKDRRNCPSKMNVIPYDLSVLNLLYEEKKVNVDEELWTCPVCEKNVDEINLTLRLGLKLNNISVFSKHVRNCKEKVRCLQIGCNNPIIENATKSENWYKHLRYHCTRQFSCKCCRKSVTSKEWFSLHNASIKCMAHAVQSLEDMWSKDQKELVTEIKKFEQQGPPSSFNDFEPWLRRRSAMMQTNLRNEKSTYLQWLRTIIAKCITVDDETSRREIAISMDMTDSSDDDEPSTLRTSSVAPVTALIDSSDDDEPSTLRTSSVAPVTALIDSSDDDEPSTLNTPSMMARSNISPLLRPGLLMYQEHT